MTAEAALPRSELHRSVAVLPGVIGVAAVVALLGGAYAANMTEAQPQRTLVWLAAALVLGAMLSGFVANHYLGLTLFLVAGLLTSDGPLSAELATVSIVTFWACHELGRFSLDARLPSRFGPGSFRRFGLRALVVPVLCLVAVVAAVGLEGETVPPILLPVAMALACMPLFLRRAVMSLPSRWRARQSVRAGLGVGVAVLAVGGALVGTLAQAELGERIPDEVPVEQSDDILPEEPARPDPGGGADETAQPVSRFVLALVISAVAVLVAALLLVALRRPEVGFELDELQLETDHTSFTITGTGAADLDDHTATMDEQAYVDLLDDLLLDLSTEPDPARAIRFGYATIARRLAALGIERAPSETERELLARALPALPGDHDALVTLTMLFEAARFSPEPASEQMRGQALEAVASLQHSIDPRDLSSPPSEPGSDGEVFQP